MASARTVVRHRATTIRTFATVERRGRPEVSGRIAPLCELLLDCYLDFGEGLPDQDSRSRAQQFAAGAVRWRSVIRVVLKQA